MMTDETDIEHRVAESGRGGTDDLPENEAEQARQQYERGWHDVTNSVDDWGWLDDGADPDAIPQRPALLEHEGDTILPRGKVVMLAGAGGVGKSTALTQLALAVATGGEWLDTFDVPEPGNVFLALGEDDELSARRGIVEAADALGLDDDQISKIKRHLVVAPLKGKQKTLTEEPASRLDVQRLKQFGDGSGDAWIGPDGETHHLDALRSGYTDHADTFERRLADRDQWSLIIVDPIRRFAGNDVERDAAAATRMVRLLSRWAAREYRDDDRAIHGPTVLLSHHTGKKTEDVGGSELYQKVRQQGLARGSSAITDGVRWQGNMVYGEVEDPHHRGTDDPPPRDFVLFAVAKTNDDRRRETLKLARQTHGTLKPAPAEMTRQDLRAKGEIEADRSGADEDDSSDVNTSEVMG